MTSFVPIIVLNPTKVDTTIQCERALACGKGPLPRPRRRLNTMVLVLITSLDNDYSLDSEDCFLKMETQQRNSSMHMWG